MDEQSIFLAALDKSNPADRAAWLDEACAGDDLLKQRIAILLQRHQQAKSFLENPSGHLDATIIPDSPGQNRAASLAAGLAAAFTDDQSVVIGNADHSVLKSLQQKINVPRVALRDKDGNDPIVRPRSPEIPKFDSDSRYRLDGEIARGGMGAILKGRDTDLGRDLAIKVLLDSHKDKPEVIQRFIEEAQIGGQLQHPGIAPIYELGQFADKRPFFAMKLVKGETLAKLLADREESAKDRGKFVGIFEQVCQTIAYAHSRGVIHRDLKPANIMIGAFGEVQVMDWGLAKVLPAGGVADEKQAHHKSKDVSIIQTLRSSGGRDTPGKFGTVGSNTQMGSVMGTPAYMPPEQALGEIDNLDERADVFGLGAILCEILTRKPPYVADNGTQVYRMASRGKLDDCFARLSVCEADVELIGLTKHCLELEPANRPRNAGVLAQRVTEYLESVETKLRVSEMAGVEARAKAVEEAKRRKLTVALAFTLLLAMALGTGGWLYLDRQRADREAFAATRVNESLNKARLHQGLANTVAAEVVPDLDLLVRELVQAVDDAHVAVQIAAQENIGPELQRTCEALLADLERRTDSARKLAAQAAADQAFQEELEDIRLLQSEGGKDFDMPSAHIRYKAAFRRRGLDVLELDTNEAARRIRESSIRESLIAAIDNWTRSVMPENGSFAWLQIAPFVSLAGDDVSYAAFCKQMLSSFGNSSNLYETDHTCKVCLLRPGVVDLARLPAAALSRGLDDRREPSQMTPWGWTTRALLSYRGGDAQSALNFLEQSEQRGAVSVNHALNLTIQSLARHSLLQTEESRHALHAASEQIRRHLDDTNRHDLLIAAILFREAKSVIGGTSDDSWLDKLLNVSERAEAVEGILCREMLARIANSADSNDIRKELRAALTAADRATLNRIALSEEAPGFPPALSAWLGSALRNTGSMAEARRVLRHAQEQHPGDFWLNYELSQALNDDEHKLEGIGFGRAALAVRPDSSGALWYLAHRFQETGQLDEAAHAFQRLVQLRPQDYWVRANYGTLLSRLGQYDAAITEYRRAIEIEFNSIEIEFNYSIPSVHNNLANALSMNGQVNEAIAQYHKAIALDPNSATFHSNLGNMLIETGRIDEAIAEYRKAIELKPMDASAHNSLGAALCDQKQDYEGAVAAFRKAIELAPKDPHAHANLGISLRKTGRLDESIAAYRMAIELDPKHAFARKQLTIVERLADFRDKLPAFLSGDYQPTTNDDRLGLAQACQLQKRNYAAARLYSDVFAAEPSLADDLSTGNRYNAACFASLAAAGQGEDTASLDDAEKTGMRMQALDWLRADLTVWSRLHESGPPDNRVEIQRTLTHWLQDSDLAAVRDGAALEKLPPEARAPFTKLWTDVASLLEEVTRQLDEPKP